MPLDAICLTAVVEELKKTLVGGKVFHTESGAEPLQVGGADDDTAFPLAAMAAHLTGKGLGFLAHFDILKQKENALPEKHSRHRF